MRTDVRRIDLPETLEYVRQVLGIDTHACVLHFQLHMPIKPLQRNLDFASTRRKLDRVRKQVGHDLLQPCGVAQSGTRREINRSLELQLLRIDSRSQRSDHALGNCRKRYRLKIDLQL